MSDDDAAGAEYAAIGPAITPEMMAARTARLEALIEDTINDLASTFLSQKLGDSADPESGAARRIADRMYARLESQTVYDLALTVVLLARQRAGRRAERALEALDQLATTPEPPTARS